jgi:hypothetical protein
LKKLVILKGSFIDSLEEYVLRECLKRMFPECKIEIRLIPQVEGLNEETHIMPGKNRFDSR